MSETNQFCFQRKSDGKIMGAAFSLCRRHELAQRVPEGMRLKKIDSIKGSCCGECYVDVGTIRSGPRLRRKDALNFKRGKDG